jgi:hypothetical protein
MRMWTAVASLFVSGVVVATLAVALVVSALGGSARGTDVSVPTTTAEAPRWPADAAVAFLTEALGRRGLPADELGQPMVAERYLPEGPFARQRPCRAGNCGAWEVATAAGRWWVWSTGQVVPADGRASAIEQRAFGEDER